MSFQQFLDMELDGLFQTLLEGLERNAELDEQRNSVNTILPMHKYKLLQRFLSKEEMLNETIRLKCLPIFLDERTEFFSFGTISHNQSTIKSILDIIRIYSPNIETIDLKSLLINRENKETFKALLKESRHLKVLRVTCHSNKCAIGQLLLEEDFHQHDQDVQNGLLKIDYINGLNLSASQCDKILNLLPNLKSLGLVENLVPVLSYYIENDLPNRLSNLTEIFGQETTLNTLEQLIKCCPKANSIFLCKPEKSVIENLQRFPLLTELLLYFEDDDQVLELFNMLMIIGRKITKLSVFTPGRQLNQQYFYKFCPELLSLKINGEEFINE